MENCNGVSAAKLDHAFAGVTEIDAHWLEEVFTPLCHVSPPLVDPPPGYLPKKDAVMAWHDVTYGKHDWQLPRSRSKHPEREIRSRIFAQALLEGKVLPSISGTGPRMSPLGAKSAFSIQG